MELVAIESLIPYERNNKIHSDEAVDRIANSIAEFGWTYPILVDEQNIILAGHKRHKAAQKLGLKEVPILRKEGLTAEQKKAYRIIDNKSSEESEWNFEHLESELRALSEMQFDFGQFMLNDFEFPILLEGLETEESPVPPVPAQPITKPGDIWCLGEHRLLCGDSTDAANWERLFGSKRADLVVTDPPYNVDYTGKTSDAMKIDNDKFDTKEQFKQFLTDVFTHMKDYLTGGGRFLHLACRL